MGTAAMIRVGSARISAVRAAIAALAALALLAACTQTGESTNAPSSASRWPVVGAFEHFNERIEGTVWLDEARNQLRFELEGVETRFKCVGPGEIESSILGENQCRQIEGDFDLHCGVQRELFGSFEFNSCDFGFAAGVDTLTGSTVAMRFGVTDNRTGALQTFYADLAAAQPALIEPEDYLTSSGLDPEIYSLGTGFAITEDGLILTAAHVVDDQYGIKIHSGDRVAEAEIVAIDQTADLALLKTGLTFEPLPLMERTDVPRLPFGGMAIGYRITPGNPPVQTHEGALTSPARDDTLYLFKADINSGYSGGPLLSAYNLKVVGVLHAISVRHAMSNWIDYTITKLAYATNYDTMIEFLEDSLDAETMQAIVSRSHGPGAIDAVAEPDSIVLITVY